MIRGISRQIIEVKETDNIYYERAFLVVKPEFTSAEKAVLEREALKLLRAMDAPTGIRQRFPRLTPWLRFMAPAVLGAGIATVFSCAILLT